MRGFDVWLGRGAYPLFDVMLNPDAGDEREQGGRAVPVDAAVDLYFNQPAEFQDHQHLCDDEDIQHGEFANFA